ncbi:MAG: alanine racemase [Actinomycetota bacterium]
MTMLRPTWVEVDLDAIGHNVRTLSFEGVEVMAVVKADGYGHGDVRVAEAALGAGAAWLGVALVEEGLGLRVAGIEAPILVLSEFPPGSEVAAVAAALTPTLATDAGLERLAAAAGELPVPLGVHVKVDTGMHRVGVWPPEEAAGFVERVVHAGLDLEGLWTHLACADTDEVTTKEQLERFAGVIASVRDVGHRPRVLHAANTAGAVDHPASRFDLIRPGIGIYGVEPAPGVGTGMGLRPALTWRSAITAVRRLPAGRRVSYGHRYALPKDSWVATVPVGYADGYPRAGSSRADVLIGGRRCRVAGSVTMDQLIVDCGELEPHQGDEVVLVGTQDAETVSAWELAERCDTIAYEILSRIGERVPRRYRFADRAGGEAS